MNDIAANDNETMAETFADLRDAVREAVEQQLARLLADDTIDPADIQAKIHDFAQRVIEPKVAALEAKAEPLRALARDHAATRH